MRVHLLPVVEISITEMPLVKFDDFMRLTNFFYMSIGMQPYDRQGYERRSSLWISFVFYVGLFNTNVVLLGEVLYVLMAFKNGSNFVEAVMTMSYIGFVSVGEFKMMSVWWKRQPLTTFIRDLEGMFPRTQQQQDQFQLRRYLRQSTRVTNAFALLYMVLIWTYNLFTVIQYFIYERWLQIREVPLALPYFVYVPWTWQGHWTYYVMYASENLAGYTTAVGQISGDLLLCSVATQVIMHYDHVARSIMEYQVETASEHGKTEQEATEHNLKILGKTIAYHERILTLSAMMNDVFGVPLLFNFMTSSFIICFVGFQLTIGVDPDTIFKLFLFFFCSSAQVYLICHYGQLLIDASVSISHAAYNQDWIHADVRYKKMLVLVNARGQKPALLKATTFLNVSRGTMTDIMQISYKFFAVLRTMYSQ